MTADLEDLVCAGAWVVVPVLEQGVTTRHAVPQNDLYPHVVSSHIPCLCGAEEDREQVDFYTHKSWDGREEYESPEPGKAPRRAKH